MRCAVLLLVACGAAPALPIAYERALRRAEGLERDGRHREAARAYALARARCGARAELCATTLVREARERERAGDTGGALRLYEEVVRRHPRTSTAPRASRRAARILVTLGRVPEARARLERVVVQWPAHGETARALAMLLASFEDQGAILATLARLERPTAGSEIGDNVLWERARLEQQLGRGADAERTLRRLVARYRYPRGGFWDDAHWKIADLAEARGDLGAAIEALENMVAVQESSAMVGSYDLPLFDDAELRVARLWLERGRPERAVASAERLRDRYESSVLRDDAVVLQARALESMGRRAQACALRDELRRSDPHSRFLRPGRWPVSCGDRRR